ncbi:MAG TPA: GNAT family N-acetyltransferase [Rhodopila sp.]|uniref:GNAT family N-acetyltransferase n=1 Tax=Rhodopila sp. TaxID=2480087 RepID=UPI002B67CB1A|nr:GNAT family N-acetyltransferase [Rhodopila sp.]HVY14731.1 GNAT family N-acetyltransferase [Rhodopila sp.]
MLGRVTRARVTVTFLRMDGPPDWPAPKLPADMRIIFMRNPSVPFYRYLYNTVGEDYLWWLNRVMSDADLARMLANPAVTIHVLSKGEEVGGFFQLDASHWPDVNLSYFGLMPHMVGHRIGSAFLRCAVDEVWRSGATGMTVNTCTADHPRALPNYLRAGFEVVRQVQETWAIPDELGMKIPPALRV